MKKTFHIFIPELVPLENKGEEAIVRGIADVIFPDGNCEIHLLDEVNSYRYQEGIHVYPVKWFISPWLNREFGLGASWEKVRDSSCSLARNGLHKLWPSWVKRWCNALKLTSRQMRELAKGNPPANDKERALLNLLNCDYVIAGHDGALDERVCHIIDLMQELGKDCGVFGVEFRSSFRSNAILEVHRQTLCHCSFFYCRTADSLATVKKYFPKIKSYLLPDPAFGMKPATDDLIDNLIKEEGLENFFLKPVVMCTSCEPAPISRFCFEENKNPESKLSAHRRLFSELIKHIVQTYDVNVLFLPHAIGPGKALDDRIIAQDILKRSELPQERARLLDAQISARELKGLIKRGELLVAERIHSMIGATGVNTPFFCMGSETDRRAHGIIADMLGMKECIYFLNRPSLPQLKEKFDKIYKKRNLLRKDLYNISKEFKDRLESGALIMRSKITDKRIDQNR